MPTAKPRIAITVADDQYEVLSRLAALQRRPMSRIVAELVGEMTPMLAKVVATMELAARAQTDATDTIRRAVAEAETAILPHAQEVLRRYEAFGEEIGAIAEQMDEAKRPGRRRATDAPAAGGGRQPGPSSPRPVITGATKPQRRGKLTKSAPKRQPRGAA